MGWRRCHFWGVAWFQVFRIFENSSFAEREVASEEVGWMVLGLCVQAWGSSIHMRLALKRFALLRLLKMLDLAKNMGWLEGYMVHDGFPN